MSSHSPAPKGNRGPGSASSLGRGAARWAIRAALGLLVACSPDAKDPKGAAKVFVRAVAINDTATVYRMLTPATQAELGELAKLAAAHSGGRRAFTGEDLLAASLDRPRRRLSRVTTSRVSGDEAEVELSNIKGDARETLKLRRIKGLWRIVLPEARKVAQVPSSQPASLAASSSQPSPSSSGTLGPSAPAPASQPAVLPQLGLAPKPAPRARPAPRPAAGQKAPAAGQKAPAAGQKATGTTPAAAHKAATDPR